MSKVIIHPNTLAIWYGNYVFSSVDQGIKPMDLEPFEQQLTEELNSP